MFIKITKIVIKFSIIINLSILHRINIGSTSKKLKSYWNENQFKKNLNNQILSG